MRVTITAATKGEWMPSFSKIPSLHADENAKLQISFYESGVGLLASAVSLTKHIIEQRPDLIIQVGIAGTFDITSSLGKVMVINEEILGDTGVEEDGKWKDIFDLGLMPADHAPFEERKLPNPWLQRYNLVHLPEASAITVNEVSTKKERIDQLIGKYHPMIESMEGAALHYAARLFNTPFLQIRCVSNYIGERDKTKWKMKEAIENLNTTLLEYIDELNKTL